MSAAKTFNNSVLNYANKKQNWFNRNYCYLATLIIMGALCACFFLLSDKFAAIVATDIRWNAVLEPLRHANLGHLIGNLISFFVVSIFLERHFGSIKYFLIVVFSFVPASLATFAFSGSWDGVGFSVVNYFLFALFACVILFHFKNYFFGKAKWIFPLVILGLLMLLMCWNGETTSVEGFFKFGVFTSLLDNVGHWSSAIIGLNIAIFAELYSLGNPKKACSRTRKHKRNLRKIKKASPIVKKHKIYIATMRAKKYIKISCK